MLFVFWSHDMYYIVKIQIQFNKKEEGEKLLPQLQKDSSRVLRVVCWSYGGRRGSVQVARPKCLLFPGETQSPGCVQGGRVRLILVYQQHHFWSLVLCSLHLWLWILCTFENAFNHTLAPGADPHFMGPKTYMTLEILSKKNNIKKYLFIFIV